MSKTRLSCTEYVLRIKHEFLNVGFENKLYVRTVLLIIDSINSNFNPFQKHAHGISNQITILP